VLYSDGLVESRDADIDHEIARLARHVDEAAVEPLNGGYDALSALCKQLLRAPTGTAGGDDRTLLLAELTPAKD